MTNRHTAHACLHVVCMVLCYLIDVLAKVYMFYVYYTVYVIMAKTELSSSRMAKSGVIKVDIS